MILKNRIACRICLSTNVKFYHMETFQLKLYYEEITNHVLTKDDELLHFFCYQCSALLQKYHSFRELCIKSKNSLRILSTQNFQNVPLEVMLKWEQNNNKIHPLINKLDANSNLGYFEYMEVDLKLEPSLDDPLASEPVQCEENSNTFFDSDENESKFLVDEHISDYNNDGSEYDFKESTNRESKNVDESSASEEDDKYVPSKKRSKKSDSWRIKKNVRDLDPTKWKIVTLTKEEATKQLHERMEKNKDTLYKKYKHFCVSCQRGFKDNLWLMRHNMSCHNEAKGKYKCFLCKKRYPTKYKRHEHSKSHLVKYHCLQCPQIYSDKQHTILHEKYHEGVQYVCPMCDAKFQKKSTYYGHLRNSHRSGHLCQHCGESFINDVGLKLHKKIAHRLNDAGDKGIYCEKCDMTFETSEAFAEHERNSVNHVTEDDPDQSVLLKRKRQSIQVCDQCGEHFGSRIARTLHMQRVHNVRRVKAVQPVNISHRVTMCEICGSKVKLHLLARHMFIHEGKRFPCPDCDRSYSNPDNMRKHRLLHKNAKPFRCELCCKGFSSKSAVQLHVRTVHMKEPHPPRNRTRMKFGSLGKMSKKEEEE